jgi:hypothetical protein
MDKVTPPLISSAKTESATQSVLCWPLVQQDVLEAIDGVLGKLSQKAVTGSQPAFGPGTLQQDDQCPSLLEAEGGRELRFWVGAVGDRPRLELGRGVFQL